MNRKRYLIRKHVMSSNMHAPYDVYNLFKGTELEQQQPTFSGSGLRDALVSLVPPWIQLLTICRQQEMLHMEC